jgi:GNAT superfamily N-acetyltransferase
VDLLRAGGATTIAGHFEDRYEPAFVSLGFRRTFARMRMEAPTRKVLPPPGLKLQPPEEDEVLGLTKFLVDVYEGHIEQAFGMHVGSTEEWRGYVGGLFKGDSGQYLPDASYVALEGDRIIGAILVTHWMGMPLVAELGVAKDRRGRGIGRALLEAAMGRLAGRDEPRVALYVTVGNDPAVNLYRSLGFQQTGGQSVTARLES